ncbi:hypothetical protein AMECASPLE_032819 [Ameca splendens]|uniref:Uncharacterized protein n=1 Tax=Ameca splendens TaxID=208324 RepID=A0ABV0YI74_9TELE
MQLVMLLSKYVPIKCNELFTTSEILQHPSIDFLYSCLSYWGSRGASAYLQRSTGERRCTPWTGCQSFAGQHRDIQDKQPCSHPFTPKGNLERPINLTVKFLDCGRKLEYPERTHDLLAARQQCY